ncbi:MAG: Rieske (2Fe-2S) protein [Myxococcales bacterium]|nr:Rieske (2Fe-2S) protein [Myxococcales bacterium]
MAVGRRVLIRNAALLAAAQGCARRIDPARVISAPEDSAGHVTIDAPELRANGGSVSVHLGNGFVLLVANVEGTIVALQGGCPHAGCDLTWVPEDREVECPCHGSRFSSDGTVLNPPAATDLGTYPATIDASGKVVVTFYPGDGTYPKPDDTGKLTLDLASYPALAPVNGYLLGRVEFPPGPLLVMRVSPAQINAVSAVCTHLHCTVRPKGDGARLHCPCHGSEFGLDGMVLNPPALFNLDRFATSLSGQTLTIDLSKKL